jgi:RHS repeat-associated protein
VATDIASSTAFLYSGADPVQTGVAPGTIQPLRVAVLRGLVLDRADQPLPGARITVLGHPEFGETVSRDDGMFDMAVNGGGEITLVYAKAGYLPAQRQVDAPWRDFAWAPDVVLVPLDPAVTAVDLTSPTMQIARGSEETDADGTRQATVLFPGGTTASLALANGGSQAVSALHIRATEFTVGDNGPEAMPAALPPSSGYTYAVELSADEAIAAGAKSVNFSQPLPVYVENFIGAPVGSAVPAGYYDRDKGQWIASANGRVIKVVAVSGGVATIDITGDGVADDASSLGVTGDELARIGTLYVAGEELWRVGIQHFTPWDLNWPYGPPADSIPPPDDPLPENDPTLENPSEECGSIIKCETQALSETLGITGTSLGLAYHSERTPGRIDGRRLQIPVSGSGPLPSSLQRIRVEILIAGRRYQQTFAPAPNITYTFIWDRMDAYGRLLNGRYDARIDVLYDYAPQYYAYQSGEQLAAFGRPGFGGIGGAFAARSTGVVTASQRRFAQVGVWDARAAGLGGWDLDIHHAYDPTSRRIMLGDGRERSGDSVATIITTVAGNGVFGNGADGGPATGTPMQSIGGMAAAPDGGIYIAEGYRIRRVRPDGIITTIAGQPNPDGAYAGDGGPATSALLSGPGAIALGPDGSVYFVDYNTNGSGRIRRVAPSGIITTVAGNGVNYCFADGVPATSTCLGEPADIAVAPDGSLYIADFRNYRIRKVGTDGIISTVAGTLNCFPNFGCYVPPLGDGGPAIEAGLDLPASVALGPDGSLYIVANGSNSNVGSFIRRVTPDGIIHTVAGGGAYNPVPPEGVPATSVYLSALGKLTVAADGGIYFPEGNAGRIRYISPDGILTTVAGNGIYEFSGDPNWNPYGDGGPGLAVSLNPYEVDLMPDESVLIADGAATIGPRVRRLGPALPNVAISDILLPSSYGRELFLFNSTGRHLRTLDALTGAVHFEFAYDGDGHLASVTDASGNVTSVERSGGFATAIVAPGGQRTELQMNGDGWLTRASDPLGHAHTMSYSAGGLLLALSDPVGSAHAFTYDSLGRLVRDDAPGGTYTTLARSELADGFSVTTTTALGRTHTYVVHRLPTGIQRVDVSPSGEVTTTLGNGAKETTTFGNGATVSAEYTSDPRWGILAPVVKNVTMTTPGGRTRTITTARTATLAVPTNLFSLIQQTETVTEGTAITTRVYDAATRTFTLTTPEGRTSTATLDALGRTVSYDPGPGVSAVVDSYDARGRLTSETQGVLSQSYGYDALNRMTSATDGAGNTTTYEYDAAGRMTASTTPGGRRYGFAYDDAGNLTSITMPSGAVHALTYTSRDELDVYTPPSGGTIDRGYNADREWTGQTLGSGRTFAATYDAGARPSGRAYAEASVAFSYAGATERMSSMSWTPAGGSAQTNTATWDAELPLTSGSGGTAAGEYTFGYDARMLLASMDLSSGADAANIALARDGDGLLTNYGPFAISHTGDGLPTTISNAQLTLSQAYDAQGRMTRRTHVVAGTTIYQLDLTYDAAGRIATRTETTVAGAVTRVYTYDADGQLTGVSVGGSPVESYSYDANGNRSAASAAANYDAADRLTSLGGTAYAFDNDGYLASRGADTFQYTTRGELLSATVAGQPITYAYDALGRRVSRTQAGATTQYLYGNPANPLQLTASRDGAGVLSVYYYGSGGGLFAMDRGGVRYYVATDQVGSPRVVSDASGTVIKTMTYDSYGKPLSDSNPSFGLAVGYAGGLADAATGLVHFGFRDYDPGSGTWTSRDPALFGGGSLNLYGYVNGNPVSHADPTGLWSITVGGSLYELLGGGASLTIGSDGFKVCGEVGVGFGGGLELGASAKGVGDTQLTLTALAEVSAKAGPLKAGVGGELTRAWGEGKCTHGKVKLGLGVTNSPLEIGGSFDVLNPGAPDIKGKLSLAGTGEPGGSLGPYFKSDDKAGWGNVGVSAKAAIKACGGASW